MADNAQFTSMEYNIQIRKATEKDFESIFRLIKEFSIFIKTPEKVSVTLGTVTV